ncbi:phosphatase PAP2 family protein [Flagellimonas allohymeniacidonis]|uniref:Phosphatase PAP2 family protein n=1 Tax=Flagellimonas allohymeniacidonis TaxID=2517819 RepID=A0A4Q8QER1_9FLAO|nr:phosphatase PAP2 family protein [Allomuricauda hymeniacidonis]TAI46789.1 phosphatase PAP2 family protein [Allomuricauda hymeniacidonis]
MFERLIQWDKEVLLYLNGLGSEKYDFFWLIITKISTWIPLFLIFGLLLFIKFPRRIALSKFALVAVLAFLITWLAKFVKIWSERLRPCNDESINAMMRILKTPGDYSFFSGHASSSFSITLLVFLFLREKVKWAPVFFVWPLLFSYSRLYLGVHFPLDVMAGAFAGVLLALIFYLAFNRFTKPDSMSVHP